MTDPQPVPDAYRCGDLNDDEWEAKGSDGEWRRPSVYPSWAIRPARRKAPPLTPREGDAVVGKVDGIEGEVVYVAHDRVVVEHGDSISLVRSLSDLTVTDRPPKRPVRVWLSTVDVSEVLAVEGVPGIAPPFQALIDACRALVDGEG